MEIGKIRNDNTEIESKIQSVMSEFLLPHGLYSPWNSSGQNTGVGNLSLLQEIFPTQGSNPTSITKYKLKFTSGMTWTSYLIFLS